MELLWEWFFTAPLRFSSRHEVRVARRGLSVAQALLPVRLPYVAIPQNLGLSTASHLMFARGQNFSLVYAIRGPRSTRAGRNMIARSNSNTPPTAIPTIRNGSRISHTIG